MLILPDQGHYSIHTRVTWPPNYLPYINQLPRVCLWETTSFKMWLKHTIILNIWHYQLKPQQADSNLHMICAQWKIYDNLTLTLTWPSPLFPADEAFVNVFVPSSSSELQRHNTSKFTKIDFSTLEHHYLFCYQYHEVEVEEREVL